MIHVLPNNDLKEHEECSSCLCHPQVVMGDEIVCIHNAWDARELFEKGLSPQTPIGITDRSGLELKECDVVETIQGSRFYCVSISGLICKLIDSDNNMFDLEPYMSPNLFYIGSMATDMSLRNEFFLV